MKYLHVTKKPRHSRFTSTVTSEHKEESLVEDVRESLYILGISLPLIPMATEELISREKVTGGLNEYSLQITNSILAPTD